MYAAKATNAIVVPVAIHGSCYLNPFSIGFTMMNRCADRVLKWPFFPFSPLIPLVLAPRNFILPWPTRMVYELLDPIEFDGPNELELNRVQAARVREVVATRLRAGRSTFWRSTNWLALLRGDYGWGMYRQFWATHLGRPLRMRERASFNDSVPGSGGLRIWRGSRDTINESC